MEVAREEATLDTERLLMSFTLQLLLSCIGHRFGGALRNLSIGVILSKIRTTWDFFVNADFRSGKRARRKCQLTFTSVP